MNIHTGPGHRGALVEVCVYTTGPGRTADTGGEHGQHLDPGQISEGAYMARVYVVYLLNLTIHRP